MGDVRFCVLAMGNLQPITGTAAIGKTVAVSKIRLPVAHATGLGRANERG